MESELRVYADLKGLAVPVGRLWVKDRAGKESATFEYEAGWLKHPQRFALAPNLMLTTGKFHSADDLFNAFTDPAPDRWGRKLMRHFEVESAKAEGRTPRTLLGSDFLAGVDDEVRLGALRFKRPGDDKFLAHTGRPVPPLIELAELLSATDRIEKGKPRKKDIQLVLAPGGSLGGARPKATVRDRGKLHIAKFPWVRDEWPVIQWEAALLEVAAAAGVMTPPARLERVGTKSVLLMDRFDREGSDVRVPFMSAMTALDAKDHSEDRSYIEILDVIRQFGAFPKEDARQLWRRMAFNVLVSNTDDHLRNHGFLWAGEGWRLAPAYDMNPSPPHISPRIHVLALNELDHTSSIDTVMAVSKDFGLALAEAKAIAGEVASAVSGWKTAAAKARLSKDDIAFMADAFDHGDLKMALAFGSAAATSPSIGAKGKKGAVRPGSAKATKRATPKKGAPRKRSAAGGK
ncbi:MAG: type II toxin-antitoxin system HipA family toxin [Hyphomonadaceae bacterium]|nr:type II toxin-antitoxin system HipA family toxin [Hyphomonadaceae bacterium]